MGRAEPTEEQLAQRDDALRLIRPMAIPTLAARRTDGLHNQDRTIRFRPPPPGMTPRGDERQILRPFISDLENEKIINPNGSTAYRKRSPSEVEALTRQMLFKQAFTDEELDLLELTPYRIRAAWRIVREIGRLKHFINADDTLLTAFKPGPLNADPWVHPEPWVARSRQDYNSEEWQECIDLIKAAETIPEDLQHHKLDPVSGTMLPVPGVAVLPPEVPPRFFDYMGNLHPTYDPNDDTALVIYTKLVQAVSKRLYIESGSSEDQHQGRYGLMGLLDVETIRLAFPTRLQIITWEQFLIEETLELLVEGSTQKTKQTLYARYGLMHREVMSLLRLSQILSMEMTAGGVDEARTIMVLRLEEYRRRAQDAFNMQAEMAALKQLSIVQGLGQEKPDDFFKMMVDQVRNINQDKPLLLPKKVENTATTGRLLDMTG